MAARSSLYNEDRNLLRIRERERRNQEAHQEKQLFLENAPLFGEPYKTNKGDELSSRIQSMLGNYEEVTELISNRCHQDLIGIPQSTAPPVALEKPGQPLHADKTQQPPFHNNPSRPGLPPSGSCPSQLHKKPSFLEHGQQCTSYSTSSLNRGLGSDHHLSNQRKTDVWPDLEDCANLPTLLPALSPPAEPLSPLHSSEPSDSEPQDYKIGLGSESNGGDGVLLENEKDVPSATPAVNEAALLPSQTFPPPLPSKTNLVMPQKPTAYVRPMDGQDHVPNESPELKPSLEDFHGQSYGNYTDLKGTAKAKLSKLKIPSQPIETLSNEAYCVEEILREMTHSWPPPLTAIHTPSTTEPSKFPFPAKESQHANSGFVGQKRYGSSPKAPLSNCQQGSFAPQSSSVVLTHSSGGESASSSESESTSGSESESESSSSDGEEAARPQRSCPPAPEADAPTANKWQLDNWIVKVNQQNSNVESQGDLVPSLSPGTKQPGEVEAASPAEEFKPKDSFPPTNLGDGEARTTQEASYSQAVRHKSPARSEGGSQRQTVGNKQPCRPLKSLHQEDNQSSLKVESFHISPQGKDQAFTDKPKVKTKNRHQKTAPKTETNKAVKTGSSDKKKLKEPTPKLALQLNCKREGGTGNSPSTARVRQPSPVVRTNADKVVTHKDNFKKCRAQSPGSDGQAPAPEVRTHVPSTLVVKIELSLLSRIPQPAGKLAKTALKNPGGGKKRPEKERSDVCSTPTKVHKKRPAESDGKSLERKRPRLDKEVKPSCSNHSLSKAKVLKHSGEKEKGPQPPAVPVARAPSKEARHKRRNGEGSVTSQPSANTPAKDSGPVSAKHKKGPGKHAEHTKRKKAKPNNCPVLPVPSLPTGTSKPSRPLLKFDSRQYPVEHHMKEAKKLKHKADAMVDKIGKAFNYLDAAVSFIESGIAMESDPQTPKSAYTMFSETVDLIRFIMKLKNFVDPSAPAPERTIAVLCMRCQSLLQMAMFRYKREAALKYSRTLTEHFKISSRSAQAPSPCVVKSSGTPSPMSPMPSPASSGGSGPGSNHSTSTGSVATVAIPQVIQQVASSYVNITALFLSAHDVWEQADALTQKGAGLLTELDSALGPLSLTSSMSSLVRHAKQGLQWLRLDTNMS
ncbi:AF4/FMR2 family member 1 [Amia ocellicauda]|uniref:AF4/FMR2 family member 1 n=1 Tax=Amia ocellicauda TaxID=2972642 RepID=UPI003464C3E6